MEIESLNSNHEHDKSEETVQDLIEAAGTTQVKLAQRIGVSHQTINSWLYRRKTPKADNFFAMCRELNLSPKKLGKMLGINVEGVPDDVPLNGSAK